MANKPAEGCAVLLENTTTPVASTANSLHLLFGPRKVLERHRIRLGVGMRSFVCEIRVCHDCQGSGLGSSKIDLPPTTEKRQTYQVNTTVADILMGSTKRTSIGHWSETPEKGELERQMGSGLGWLD